MTTAIENVGELGEDSSGTVNITFLGLAGVEETPVTISYRIDDEDSGKEIKADTAFTPVASTIALLIKPADTAIQNKNSRFENRIVTVTAGYGVDDQINDRFKIQVNNFRFLT